MKKKYKNLPYDETHKKIYSHWKSMRRRCNSKTFSRYKDYGGRGIKICKEWENFENFYKWAIKNGFDITKKQINQSLDRINNNGNYEPNNCRWTNIKIQNRNQRSNCLITYNNQTHCVSEWAELYNINVKTLRTRMSKGWNIDRCLNQPIKRR